ncbi:putative XS domain-containing protein [Medicago truncatula]|nr:protein SUPPRESSOR OF GENE SILENCING 3 [Medicago truncatula]RHN70043.1 putative XS domain-containing protein [Medicago truncatula]
MSYRRSGRPFTVVHNNDFRGKCVSQFYPNNEQLIQGIADVNLGSGQDDGLWETYSKKSKNRGGSIAAKQLGCSARSSNPRACGGDTDMAPMPGMRDYSGAGRAAGNLRRTPNTGYMRPAGRGYGRPHPGTGGYGYNGTSNPIIRPPPEGVCNRKSMHVRDEIVPEEFEFEQKNDDEDDDDEGDDDCDDLEDTDYDLMSDEYDSDASQKSHETRKKSKWFRKFFEYLDKMTIEQINEPEREWHCPACQSGPGSIDWYSGLLPLMNHAKTKGSKRVKVHRELAVLLDEELRRRGGTVVPAGESFGKWKGLKEEEKDHEIVWPPMVIIQNTKLEEDENNKWTGMGNQELLDYFSSYAAVRARHSYGPNGHRGMSVLMFEASASGYLEAERLHKHFTDQGTNRETWFSNHRSSNLFLPGGNRQLFGYMAAKDDLEFFNRHCQGKPRLKYEMKSYQEMVVHQIRQMSEDNQQLLYLKNKMVKEMQHSKALEESFGIVTEKLRKTMEENRIVRRRTKMQHEEIKEEMYEQEQFFKERISSIRNKRNAKEENFERMQQEEREKVKKSSIGPPSNAEERRLKVEGYLKFVELQDKEMENFVEEKEKLSQAHEESIAAMRKRHWEEEEEMEKKFDEDLAKLMEKYSPSHR